MKIKAGTPLGHKVDKVLFNGEYDKNHKWIEVDTEAGVGTRYLHPIKIINDEMQTETVEGEFEITWKDE